MLILALSKLTNPPLTPPPSSALAPRPTLGCTTTTSPGRICSCCARPMSGSCAPRHLKGEREVLQPQARRVSPGHGQLCTHQGLVWSPPPDAAPCSSCCKCGCVRERTFVSVSVNVRMVLRGDMHIPPCMQQRCQCGCARPHPPLSVDRRPSTSRADADASLSGDRGLDKSASVNRKYTPSHRILNNHKVHALRSTNTSTQPSPPP